MTRYLTLQEVAARLGVSKSTAYEWAHRPDFPVSRITRRNYRVPEDALEQWLNAQLPEMARRNTTASPAVNG